MSGKIRELQQKKAAISDSLWFVIEIQLVDRECVFASHDDRYRLAVYHLRLEPYLPCSRDRFLGQTVRKTCDGNDRSDLSRSEERDLQSDSALYIV